MCNAIEPLLQPPTNSDGPSLTFLGVDDRIRGVRRGVSRRRVHFRFSFLGVHALIGIAGTEIT